MVLRVQVDHAAKEVRADFGKALNAGNNVGTSATTNTEDVEDPVDARRDRLRVVHVQNRRRVDEHHVVLFAKIREQLVKVLTREKFGGVLALRTRSHDVQILNRGFMSRRFNIGGSGKNVGKPLVVDKTKPLMNVRFSHIAVDQKNLFARLRNLNGKVGDAHRFTVAGVRTRAHNDGATGSIAMAKELGAHLTEKLAHLVVRMIIRKERGIGQMRLEIFTTPFRSDILKPRHEGRNLDKDRNAACADDFRRRMERRVGNVDEVRDRNAENHAENKTDGDKSEQIRINRIHICGRLRQHFNLVCVDVAHERELLQTLIQVLLHRF